MQSVSERSRMTNKLMREQFEDIFSPRGFSMVRDEGGHYEDLMTEGAWRGWVAAKTYPPYKHKDSSPHVFATHADEALEAIEQEKRTQNLEVCKYCGLK